MNWWLSAIIVALVLVPFGIERVRWRRRLSAIDGAARQALAASGQPPPSGPSAPLASLERTVALLATAATAATEAHRLDAENAVRLEQALVESHERHALAASSAGDGLWEWDLKTGRVDFSIRWKSLLGYADHELANHQDTWFSRIHPDDRDLVVKQLEDHLEGRTPSFISEHRVRNRHGEWQWLSARATAIRHANGRPYRLTGLMTDTTARRRLHQLLVDLAESLWLLKGDDCFRQLVQNFAQAIGVTECFVCECVNVPTTRVRMLARWKGGEFSRCVDFDLEGTPCDTVINDRRVVYVPSDMGLRWPVEMEYGRNSYLGVPCFDSDGNVIGHVACADPGPMPEQLPEQALLKLFAVRASLELERRRLTR